MRKHVMTVMGQPLQWLVGEGLQEYILKPYLEASGFSRKSCPTTLFESPDTAKKEEGEYWVALVTAQIQSPQQACEHLGMEYDQDFWDEQAKKEQEIMQKNIQQQGGEDGESKDAKPEQYEEYTVRRRMRKTRD